MLSGGEFYSVDRFEFSQKKYKSNKKFECSLTIKNRICSFEFGS